MKRVLYLQCESGISGDMTVGALLDLGASEEVLRRALASLPLTGYEIQIRQVQKAGLAAKDFLVQLDAAHENYDHDMDYLYGFQYGAQESHHHHLHEEPQHHHDHGRELAEEKEPQHHHEHHHEHRTFLDVKAILEAGQLSVGALALAKRIFTILGEAEAKAHGTTLQAVHFHEVGAVDSIVDIVATAVCLDNLGIQEVAIPVLHEGKGSVRCAHGILPIPVPAVAAIAQTYHLPLSIMNAAGEYVTPTGAAIAAAIATTNTLPPRFTIEKIGIGSGKREQARPSLLRAMLLALPEEDLPAGEKTEDKIWKLETNLDDSTGETLGYTMEQLLATGARDVAYTPVYMKKNRPGILLTVICTEENRQELEQVIFRETSTIGIRRVKMERTILSRKENLAETSLGLVRVKTVEIPTTEGIEKRSYPEYESLAAICLQTGRGYWDVYQEVMGEISGK